MDTLKKKFQKSQVLFVKYGEKMNLSEESQKEFDTYIKDPAKTSLSDKAMDEIYEICSYNGIFSGDSSGIRDRQNSVNLFLESLEALLNKSN